MLQFSEGSPLKKGRVGIFPGAFNPPTNAHFGLAQAAQEQYQLDQVVFLLPAAFPHKPYIGASFDDRMEMLREAVGGHPGWAIASSDHGLFIDIAEAFQAECGPDVELYLLCGRDAAERIVGWDYGEGPSFGEQLDHYQLLVATRTRPYLVPAKYQGRIYTFTLPASLETVSSSAVREARAAGGPWRHLVPGLVARRIEQRGLYLKSPDRSP